MKTFEEELQKEIDNQLSMIRPGMEGVGYDGGFIDGLEHAQQLIDKHKDDAIDEILTKYHEWASNIIAMRFAKWEEEEGDFDKTKDRIRREFIEYLNQKK